MGFGGGVEIPIGVVDGASPIIDGLVENLAALGEAGQKAFAGLTTTAQNAQLKLSQLSATTELATAAALAYAESDDIVAAKLELLSAKALLASNAYKTYSESLGLATAAQNEMAASAANLTEMQIQAQWMENTRFAAIPTGGAAAPKAAKGGGGGFAAMATEAVESGVVIAGALTFIGNKWQEANVKLQQQSGESSESVGKIGDAMLSLGANGQFGAIELTNSLAGIAGRLNVITGTAFSAADATRVMSAAENLAAASGMSLADSSSALVNTMLSFDKGTADAAHTADILFNTLRVTGVPSIQTMVTQIDRLKDRLGTSAPDIASLGALVGELRSQGVDGARGLQLSASAIENLTGGSKAVNTELTRLGIGVFDAQGNFIGLRSVIAELNTAWKGMSQQQQDASAKILFGAGAAGMLTNVVKDGLPVYDSFIQKENESGTAADAAAVKLNSFSGQFNKLKSTTETGLIIMAQPFIAGLKDAMKALNDFADEISKVSSGEERFTTALNNMSGKAQLFAEVISGGILVDWAKQIGLVDELDTAFSASVDHMKNAWSSFVDGLPNAWVGAFGILIKGFQADMNDIENIWKSGFALLPSFMKGPLDEAVGLAESAGSKIGNALKSGWDWLTGGGGGGSPSSSGPKDLTDAQEKQASHNSQLDWLRTQGELTVGVPPGDNATIGGGGGGGGSSSSDTKTEFGLIALANAFAIFNAQTGSTSIDAFKAWLDMESKMSDALGASAVKMEELTNPAYGLVMALGAIKTHLLETNQTAEQFMRNEVFMPALNAFKSALNDLFSKPTKETMGLQLQKDQLELTRLEMVRRGAKPNELKGIDKEISGVDNQIAILQKQNDIWKLTAEMKDNTIQTEQQVLDQSVILGGFIDQTSRKVVDLNNSLGWASVFVALTLINFGNAVNGQAAIIRAGGNATGGPAGGGFATGGGFFSGFSTMNEGSSGSSELVKLPSGSWVFSAAQSRAMLGGGKGGDINLNLSFNGQSRAQIMQAVADALDRYGVDGSMPFISGGINSPNG